MRKLTVVFVSLWLVTATSAMAQAVKNNVKPVKPEKSASLVKREKTISLKGLTGTWWRNPVYVDALNLTPEQQKKMDDVLQDSRLKLIDANAKLDKEELVLEPLMNVERLDEAQVLSQIDRIAQARAELEKVNARMLLGIRQIMTSEQWSSLQSGKVKMLLKQPFLLGNKELRFDPAPGTK